MVVHLVSLVLWSYDHLVELNFNKVLSLDYSFSYTTPTALGIRQKVEQNYGQLCTLSETRSRHRDWFTL